jgi:integral membrane protein
MYFKYLGSPRTELGVKVFGPIHGGVFVAFAVAALLVGIALKWGAGTWILALLASVVPMGSVIFIIWADRTGRMGAGKGTVVASAATAQPGAPVPETRV